MSEGGKTQGHEPHPDDLRPFAFWHDFKRGFRRVFALIHRWWRVDV